MSKCNPKNERKKINRSMLGTLLGRGRGTGADPVVFRPGRAGFGGLGEDWRRVAGAVHYLGRRHGDVLRQWRSQDQAGHYFSETGTQPEPGTRRRFHPAGARLSLRQVAVPAGHMSHDGAGVGGDRLRPAHQGRGDPADDLVGR